MKKFTKEEIIKLYGQVTMGEISFSQMVEVLNERVNQSEVSEFKDGDFVVNMNGRVLIFKNKVGDSIYDHAYLADDLIINTIVSSNIPIERYATEEEKQKMLNALAKRGKRWNAEKLCIEDIPVRRFKKGDKVRIKEGISSKTHMNISPRFIVHMDDLIGKELTVDRYVNRMVYIEESYYLHEDWLEPYEELKEGDLAIFWDHDKEFAIIRRYYRSNNGVVSRRHQDIQGLYWANAIKFESVEQFERLIKGEI